MISVYKYNEVSDNEIFARVTKTFDISDTVSEIIKNIRTGKDKALLSYTEKFDKVKLDSITVSKKELDDAMKAVSPEFIRILKKAAANIRKFHEQQKRSNYIIAGENGALLGQRIIPIDKVGLYVPGGTAAYPSTVLMDSIPAQIAGCRQIVIVTPPGPDGKINDAILAAAQIAGIDKIYKVGGAQAVAALAYGTETIEQVDKIVGPGNAFVAEAKKQVFGQVSIDMIAGPSEILVIADKSANPEYIAADLLSQAEHDKMASAVLITDSMKLAKEVAEKLELQLPELLRHDIARASIDNNGKIIVADDLSIVIDIANKLAPEHLELCVEKPFDYLDKIVNAGSVFLGHNCPEALGDYYAGANHTLPTGGTARFSSPLSVDDFVKKSQFIYYTEEAFKDVASDVDFFAKQEGLTAHGRSAMIRLEGNKE